MYKGYIDVVSARTFFDDGGGFSAPPEVVKEYRDCYQSNLFAKNRRRIIHIRTLLSRLSQLSDEAIEHDLFDFVWEG